MTTQTTKQPNRQAPAEQVVFVEYSTANKGQHFMTVMGKENGRRKIVARIFREFDPTAKEMKYKAKDREGKEVFPDVTSLYDLKKKFIENAKQQVKTVSAPEKGEAGKTQVKKKSLAEKALDTVEKVTDTIIPSSDTVGKSEGTIEEKIMENLEKEHNKVQKDVPQPIAPLDAPEEKGRHAELKSLREKEIGKSQKQQLER